MPWRRRRQFRRRDSSGGKAVPEEGQFRRRRQFRRQGSSGGKAVPEAEARHFVKRRQGIPGDEGEAVCERDRWTYKMASNGRDFAGKVWRMAYSNCQRPRNGCNTAPDGHAFCLPTAAVISIQLHDNIQIQIQDSCNLFRRRIEATFQSTYQLTSAGDIQVIGT